uniref:Uncharacterized protein n=1 Tax=viral metagenome TaxID=1070528 RepID=A0A6C0BNL1_9ZZZZ
MFEGSVQGLSLVLSFVVSMAAIFLTFHTLELWRNHRSPPESVRTLFEQLNVADHVGLALFSPRLYTFTKRVENGQRTWTVRLKTAPRDWRVKIVLHADTSCEPTSGTIIGVRYPMKE